MQIIIPIFFFFSPLSLAPETSRDMSFSRSGKLGDGKKIRSPVRHSRLKWRFRAMDDEGFAKFWYRSFFVNIYWSRWDAIIC
jgi:hypothetical protein